MTNPISERTGDHAVLVVGTDGQGFAKAAVDAGCTAYEKAEAQVMELLDDLTAGVMGHRTAAASGQKHGTAGYGETEIVSRFLFDWNLKGNHTSTSSKISEGGARTICSETSSLLGTFFVFCFFRILLPEKGRPHTRVAPVFGVTEN
jgi:hypothetical protein